MTVTVMSFTLHVLQSIRDHMFEEAKPFTGFTEGCHKESVSPLLLALVNRIPTITDHCEGTTHAVLSIAQLLTALGLGLPQNLKHNRLTCYMLA